MPDIAIATGHKGACLCIQMSTGQPAAGLTPKLDSRLITQYVHEKEFEGMNTLTY